MKKYLKIYCVIILCVAIISNSYAQKKIVVEIVDTNKVYRANECEQEAKFASGRERLSELLQSLVRYPISARESGLEGIVIVECVIDRNGNILNPLIKKGLSPDCDKEAMQGFRKLPKLIPARIKGKPVSMICELAAYFTLDGQPKGIDTVNNNTSFYNKYDDNTIQTADIDDIAHFLLTNMKIEEIPKYTSLPIKVNHYTTRIIKIGKYDTALVYARYGSNTKAENVPLSGETATYKHVLIGNPITLVAVKYLDGKSYFAIKKTTVSSQAITDLIFTPATINALQSAIK